MAGSSPFVNHRITTWGESRGCRRRRCDRRLPGRNFTRMLMLNRRKPGQSKFTTQRKESDQAEILSGVFEGRTTGTPISCGTQSGSEIPRLR